MQQKKRFGHHQPQHRVAQKLQPFVVARFLCILRAALQSQLADRPLVRQGPMGQRTPQQPGPRKPMPQCAFQFRQLCLHTRLDRVHSLDSF